MKTATNAKNRVQRSAQGRATSEPSNEEIKAIAHSFWEEEGRPEGRELEHWFKAEALLRKKRKSTKADSSKQP